MAMIDYPTTDERRTEAQRLLAGLANQWVSDRFGNSKATVRLWRSGERVPNLENLLRLADACDRTLDVELHARIFGGKNAPAVG